MLIKGTLYYANVSNISYLIRINKVLEKSRTFDNMKVSLYEFLSRSIQNGNIVYLKIGWNGIAWTTHSDVFAEADTFLKIIPSTYEIY